MIYDHEVLKLKFKDYSNINQKISLEVKKGKLTRIKKELYTDSLDLDKYVIANVAVDPSYISFEYALSYYGLIPEYVSVITSSCYNKKNYKKFTAKNITFEYRSIPNDAYPYGIKFYTAENNIKYKMASKEKALCDCLYSKYPVRFIEDIKILLFEDLRIDENEFWKLDFEFIKQICDKYHSNTIKTLVKFIEGANYKNEHN